MKELDFRFSVNACLEAEGATVSGLVVMVCQICYPVLIHFTKCFMSLSVHSLCCHILKN